MSYDVAPEGVAGASQRLRERRFHAGRDALSLVGYLFGGWVLLIRNPHGLTVAPDTLAYLRAGHALLTGAPVYVGHIGETLAFNYSPPWALLVAVLSLLPPIVVQALLSLGSVAALRYVAGSWHAVGYALLLPLTPMFLVSGNIDLFIAAAMVAAWRGPSWPLALTGLAKLAPFLGLPPRQWRQALAAVAVAALATLPWWHLWPEWVAYLLRQPVSISGGLAIAWWARLPVAVLVIGVLRRPWASALAVVIAMPSLYLWTTMEVLAVVRLWWDGRRGGQAAPYVLNTQ